MNYNVLSINAFEKKKQVEQTEVVSKPFDEQPSYVADTDLLSKENEKLQADLKHSQIQLQEHKVKSKELQKSLASQVVILEEDIEVLKEENEENLEQAETGYRFEIEKVKAGCHKREVDLLAQMQKLQDRNVDLEMRA